MNKLPYYLIITNKLHRYLLYSIKPKIINSIELACINYDNRKHNSWLRGTVV